MPPLPLLLPRPRTRLRTGSRRPTPLLPPKRAPLRAQEAAARHPDGPRRIAPATTTVAQAPRGPEDSRGAPGETGIITAPRPPQIASAITTTSLGTRRTIVNAPAHGTRATPLVSATLPTPLGSLSSSSSNLNEVAPKIGAIPALKEAEEITPANTTRRRGTIITRSPTTRVRETLKAKG